MNLNKEETSKESVSFRPVFPYIILIHVELNKLPHKLHNLPPVKPIN